MGLFGAKKQEKTELSSLPELPEPPDAEDSPDLNDFRNEDLKLKPLQQQPQKLETKKSISPLIQGMEKSIFEPFSKERSDKYYEEDAKPFLKLGSIQRVQERYSGKDKGPIYIRVDKFNTAVSIMNDIKNKLNEIDKVLEKTRQIKKQEELEMEEWEREIRSIKSKLDSIDRIIFNEIE